MESISPREALVRTERREKSDLWSDKEEEETQTRRERERRERGCVRAGRYGGERENEGGRSRGRMSNSRCSFVFWDKRVASLAQNLR